MNRATTKMPTGDYVHIARLGGYYKIKNYRHCDYLIGCAPDIVRWLTEEQGWPKERAICIPNFVDTAKMAPVERTSFDTPPGKKLVVTMGRLHVNKAFDVLLRAMAKLPDLYFWLAGSGPEEASLKALATELRSTSGCASWDGGTTCRRCWRQPTLLSAHRGTSPSATWCLKPGPTTCRWCRPHRRARAT